MKYLLQILFYIFFISQGHSGEMLFENKSSSKEFSSGDNEKNGANDKLILNEIEEEKVIDQEISNEIGDNDENEEAQIIKSNYRYLLSGVAMPRENQIKRGDIYYLKGADFKLENIYFDIPVVYNRRVRKWINYYSKKGRKVFKLHIERAGRYAPLIGSILEENGLPRDLLFLAMAESGFNNLAKSTAAAVGPWQFMPATGKMYGLKQDWYVDERKDPVKSTFAAANYLAKLYNDFGSWKIAMAAYNAGEGKLGRAIKKYNSADFWHILKGNYLKSETKNYVPKIMALAIMGKNLKAFGFHDIDFLSPLDFDEITVDAGTDLIKVSEKINVDFANVQKLNPELLRWFTPLNVKDYKLRLPLKKAEVFKRCCMKMDLRATDFQLFKVNNNQIKISQVANQFRIKYTSVLSNLNKVSLNHVFKKGDKILLPFKANHALSNTNKFYADLFYKNIKHKRTHLRTFHIVKRGESLNSVAKKYNLSVKKLLAENSSIKDASKLVVGERLVIKWDTNNRKERFN